MPPLLGAGFFLSLKWKALLLSSIALLLVTGSLVIINHLELRHQFEQRRNELQGQYAQQVQGLLDQSSKRLRQWSTIMASLLNVQATAGKWDKAGIVTEFERLATIFELDMGLESILLVAPNGQLLAGHGPDAGTAIRAALADAARRVVTTETPMSLIECVDTCLQYSIAPILTTHDALIVGVSLADVVLDFRRVSGIDLGLLVSQQHPHLSNGRRAYWLAPWNTHVAALGNQQTNLAILQAASQAKTLAEGVEAPIRLPIDSRDYEVRLFPLVGFEKQQSAYLTIVADISDAMAQIRTARHRNIFLGATGLVLSELLLLAILWAPLSRLRRAAVNLPLLSRGAFAQVRAVISQLPSTHSVRDEVDILNETAIALSHQLEALNTEVASRTQDLSERMEEMTQQRNFMTHVLETAQAIILTQNQNNEILTINPYGEATTGYTLAQLQGRPFVTLLSQHEKADRIKNRLVELVSGAREHIEEESRIRCNDQRVLDVVWQHSRLKGQRTDRPMILSVGMDITARKTAELRLAWMADHDPLTGLYNRRRFTQELKEAVATARRYHRSGALLFIDLDQFKYINDTSGHPAGDRLLQRLSELFTSILREVDVIGRLGGDEFAVVLNQATADEAVQVAKKLLDHTQQIDFSVGKQIHKLSASIGIVLFPEHGVNSDDLLARADLAMYKVKESGRGGWHLLSEQDQSQRLMREHVLWKQRVEIALKDQRFLLYVQPILNIRNHTISHYEVLLRMQGEDGEIIGPAHFIEVAERSGLIHAVDRMVMSEAIRYQALAVSQGVSITLTVNLSAHAFNNPNLLERLKKLLQETQLNPQQLIFEMTETAALADLVATRHLMESINAIGCQFALDDFGTGFSSFYYLKKLPFGFIKIDGSFISALAERNDDQALVKAMGEIARAFGKKTIAEHVQDEKTMALLAEYGIDYAQGYYIGRPVPITTLLDVDPVQP